MSFKDLNELLMEYDSVRRQVIKKSREIRYTVAEAAFVILQENDSGKIKMLYTGHENILAEQRKAYPDYIKEDGEMLLGFWNVALINSDLPDEYLKAIVEEAYTVISALKIKAKPITILPKRSSGFYGKR